MYIYIYKWHACPGSYTVLRTHMYLFIYVHVYIYIYCLLHIACCQLPAACCLLTWPMFGKPSKQCQRVELPGCAIGKINKGTTGT